MTVTKPRASASNPSNESTADESISAPAADAAEGAKAKGKMNPKAKAKMRAKKAANASAKAQAANGSGTGTGADGAGKGEAKSGKQQLVRDSFTIPKNEYHAMDQLKKRAMGLEHEVRKGELLRAGIQALAAMNDKAFLAALKAVPTLKTGRPKQDKAAAAEEASED